MLTQLRQLGAPPEVLAAALEQQRAEADTYSVPVWPENWHAVRLLLAMSTQWFAVHRIDGRMQRLGLRYEALPSVQPAVRQAVERRWRQPWGVLLGQLQLLEAAVLEAEAQRLAQA